MKNPPAFPTLHIPHASPPAWSGMTLRDYFAAKAMQGLVTGTTTIPTAEKFAEVAYQLADAMLKAREA